MQTSTLETADRLISDLQRDLDLTYEQAVGVAANFAHESAGFNSLQEINPVVPGSKGGFGFGQWTGPRRRAFEAFTKSNNLDPYSYDANVKFLKHELEVDPYERAMFDKVRKARTAAEATEIISKNYLRPGVPHMDSRLNWAADLKGLGLVSKTAPKPMDTIDRSNVASAFVVPATPSPALSAARGSASQIKMDPTGHMPSFSDLSQVFGGVPLPATKSASGSSTSKTTTAKHSTPKVDPIGSMPTFSTLTQAFAAPKPAPRPATRSNSKPVSPDLKMDPIGSMPEFGDLASMFGAKPLVKPPTAPKPQVSIATPAQSWGTPQRATPKPPPVFTSGDYSYVQNGAGGFTNIGRTGLAPRRPSLGGTSLGSGLDKLMSSVFTPRPSGEDTLGGGPMSSVRGENSYDPSTNSWGRK